MSPIDQVYVRLAATRALLGAVTPNLRAVLVNFNSEKKKVSINFYYDGEIDDDTFDIASTAITEFSADFPPEKYTIDESVERLDYPNWNIKEGYLVYKRFEKS